MDSVNTQIVAAIDWHPLFISPEDSLETAVNIWREARKPAVAAQFCCLVGTAEHPLGLLTERSLMAAITGIDSEQQGLSQKVRSLMRPCPLPLKIQELDNILTLLEQFRQVEEGYLLIKKEETSEWGLLNQDALGLALEAPHLFQDLLVTEVMKKEPLVIVPTTSLRQVIQGMLTQVVNVVITLEPKSSCPGGWLTFSSLLQDLKNNSNLLDCHLGEAVRPVTFRLPSHYSLGDVQQILRQHPLEPGIVVSKQGEILGAIAPADLLTVLTPPYLLRSVERLGKKIEQMSAGKTALLQSYQQTQDQSQKLLEGIANNVPGITYLVNYQTNQIIYYNHRALNLLDYSDIEIGELGSNFITALVHPDDRQADFQQWLAIAHRRDGEIWSSQLRLKSKQGYYKWFLMRETIFERDEQGNVLKCIGLALDIHDLKQIEEVLQLTEERLRFLLESSPVVIYTCHANPQLDSIYVSKNVAQILGYLPRDLFSEYEFWLKRVHLDDLPQFRLSYSQLLQQERAICEYRFLHKQGHYLWVRDEQRLIRNEQGEPSEIIGSIIDISDRKTVELALQFSEKHLNTIVSNISDGIIILDQQGLVLFANPMAGNMFNLPVKDLLHFSIGIPISIEENWEMEIVRRDGSLGMADVKVSLVNWDSESRYLMAIRDITLRRADAEKLRKSEERYRTLMEAVPNLVWLMDSHGKITDCNDRTQQYTGLSTTEILGQTWQTLIHPQDRSHAMALWSDANHTNQPYHTEYRLRRADGSYRWHLVQALSTWDQSSQSQIWLGSCTDIDDLKQGEAIRRQQTEQERLIANITQRIRKSLQLEQILNTTVVEIRRILRCDRVLIYQVYPNGTGAAIAESVGSKWIKVLSITFPEEVFPEECYEPYFEGRTFVLNDRDRPPETGVMRECLVDFLAEIQVRAKLVVPIVQPDSLWGLLIAHQCSGPRQWEEREIHLLRQLSNQLTIAIQQSQLYEQLQIELRERQQLDRVVKKSSEFIAIANSEHQLLFLNQAGLELVGLPNLERAREMTIQEFHFEADLPFLENEVIAQILQVGHWEGELRLRHFVSQQAIPVLVTAFAIQDSRTGKNQDLVAIMRDITDIKQAENKMLSSLEQERELSELRSRFISMASHEFRTPLAIISSSTGILELYHQRLTEEKKSQHLQRIQTSVKHMTELLDDVLMVSRAEAEKLLFNPEVQNLKTFCTNLAEELQLSSNDHSIVLTTEPDSDRNWLISFDPKLIRQILTNLLSNAIKYSPQGGPIKFILSRLPDAVIFDIQDQGMGIPPEDLERLFTSFHRAHNVGTIQGTGLGLTIVKKCVDLHGGSIALDSQLGQGSRFTIRIPI